MKTIEIQLNERITDLNPATIPEAQECAKQLIKCDFDVVDIYLVEKKHILTIKKGQDE